jgi:transcription antitermination factor NusG
MRMTNGTLLALLSVATISIFPTGVAADEEPISGTVKSVDVAAQTLTLEVASKGKTRVVTVHMQPGAKIVRFVRSTEPGTTGFIEQEVLLNAVKVGWIVSATTKHEGNREVAEQIKIIVER